MFYQSNALSIMRYIYAFPLQRAISVFVPLFHCFFLIFELVGVEF